MTTPPTILAAGGVVWRPREGARRGVELLLVHRPRYDDWTFPKGKIDAGETLPETAVREIEEETGLRVRLGPALPDVHYRVTAGPKTVSYWTARLRRGDHGAFRPNREVDRILWARPRDAARLLTYDHDRRLLDDFRSLRDADGLRTRALVLQRHGKAVAREDFAGPDELRPLADLGEAQADALVGVLSAFGIERVVSSPAIRCVDTVAPFAHTVGARVELDGRLAEGVRPAAVEALLDPVPTSTVLSTHRPTLPDLFEALGLLDVALPPGHGVVVHVRRGSAVATERIG